MDKSYVESFKAHQTRRALQRALHEARTAACLRPRVEQVKPFTPNQLDAFMQRRIDQEMKRRTAAASMVAKMRKKPPLPMPIFACENAPDDQVRPRVVGAVE